MSSLLSSGHLTGPNRISVLGSWSLPLDCREPSHRDVAGLLFTAWMLCGWEGKGLGLLCWGMSPLWGERKSACCCLHSCPWCLLRLCLGMAEMMGMLLVLLCASHASASECAARFRHHLPILEYRAGGTIPEKQMVLLVQRGTLGKMTQSALL